MVFGLFKFTTWILSFAGDKEDVTKSAEKINEVTAKPIEKVVEEKESSKDSNANKENETNSSLDGSKSTSDEDKVAKVVEQVKFSQQDAAVSDASSILVLVNKHRKLSEDYVPSDLVKPNVTFAFKEDINKRYMRKQAAEALEKLFADSKKESLELIAISGYRSYARQKSLYDREVRTVGENEAEKYVAKPGSSEHQTGLAMDLSCKSLGYILDDTFEDTDEGKWIKNNCYRYGFILRYPKGKEDITGFGYEAWHIRYVGKEAASQIFSKSITLEEYFDGGSNNTYIEQPEKAVGADTKDNNTKEIYTNQ